MTTIACRRSQLFSFSWKTSINRSQIGAVKSVEVIVRQHLTQAFLGGRPIAVEDARDVAVSPPMVLRPIRSVRTGTSTLEALVNVDGPGGSSRPSEAKPANAARSPACFVNP